MRKLTKTPETGSNAFMFQNNNKNRSQENSLSERSPDRNGGPGNTLPAHSALLERISDPETGVVSMLANTDDPLVESLYRLIGFNEMLRDWYYGGGEDREPSMIYYPSYDRNALNEAYTSLFGSAGGGLKVDADTFITKMNNGELDVSAENTLKSQDLKAFFSGGTAILDQLKKDAEGCMQWYELWALSSEIKQYFTEMSPTIEKNLGSKAIRQKEIDIFDMYRSKMEGFTKIYAMSVEPGFKDWFKALNGDCVAYLAGANSKRAALVRAKEINDQRISSLGKNPPARAKDIENNIDYHKTAQTNPDFMKSQKIYNKKEKTYTIFNKGVADQADVDINDAVQGATIGDCYLISSLASMALRNPEYIRKKLIVYTPGKDYAIVNLHIINPITLVRELKPIRVDFNFPLLKEEIKFNSSTSSSSDMPMYNYSVAYAQKGDDELWVMLVEKAYAQELGGYDKIVEGTASEAFAVLTGIEVDPKEISADDTKLRGDLKAAIDSGKPIVAGTKLPETTTSTTAISSNKVEIYYKHAYSVISLVGDMVELRNPHGKEKSILIPLSDFRKFFHGFTVGEVPQN